jgi:N-acetyl sugar amidotransferase
MVAGPVSKFELVFKSMSEYILKNIFWCKNCVMMSTRPRLTFDSRGFCTACQWAEEKKKIDWSKRQKLLEKLLQKHKSKNSGYDCITTVSGGKDGSYVSHNIKNKYGMNPLTVTFRPSMETQLGMENLKSFVESGFDHIHVTANMDVLRILNRIGLIEMGFPYYGWLIGIHTSVLRIAQQMKINLIFYAEDGEVEYGGDMKHKNNGIYGIKYQIAAYLESGYNKVISKAKAEGLTEKQLYWFTFPDEREVENLNIDITHYSFYENWDPYRNYLVAKEHYNLKENKNLNVGTYTNYSQTDSTLFDLHMYFMYLKLGFGRTTSDASIDVRRGAMSRDQAVQLIRLYDDIYPEKNFLKYCEYYKISMKEFLDNIDKWANKDLFEKKTKWMPKFKIS